MIPGPCVWLLFLFLFILLVACSHPPGSTTRRVCVCARAAAFPLLSSCPFHRRLAVASSACSVVPACVVGHLPTALWPAGPGGKARRVLLPKRRHKSAPPGGAETWLCQLHTESERRRALRPTRPPPKQCSADTAAPAPHAHTRAHVHTQAGLSRGPTAAHCRRPCPRAQDPFCSMTWQDDLARFKGRLEAGEDVFGEQRGILKSFL